MTTLGHLVRSNKNFISKVIKLKYCMNKISSDKIPFLVIHYILFRMPLRVSPLEYAEGGNVCDTGRGPLPPGRAKHMSQVTKPTSQLESREVGGWVQGNYSKLLLGLSSSPSLRQYRHSQSIPSSVESTRCSLICACFPRLAPPLINLG